MSDQDHAIEFDKAYYAALTGLLARSGNGDTAHVVNQAYEVAEAACKRVNGGEKAVTEAEKQAEAARQQALAEAHGQGRLQGPYNRPAGV